jgi:hypothetical protein
MLSDQHVGGYEESSENSSYELEKVPAERRSTDDRILKNFKEEKSLLQDKKAT